MTSMNAPLSPALLQSASGGKIALKDMRIDARVHDLMAEVTVTQTYRNEEQVNIEAVYTLPLPLDAVLLDFSATLGDRRLAGQVVEKQQAQQQYEQAMTEGDAAMMLEQVEAGLYTVNVGNLLPGETAVIEFRYAVLLSWRDDTVRLHIPTVVAPRYGNPFQAGFQPHQVPEYDLATELRAAFSLSVTGLLKDAQVDSPSHDIHIHRNDDTALIVPEHEAITLDRDLVINFQSTGAASSAVYTRDGDGYAVLASFHPKFDVRQEPQAYHLTLVVDCSGSMGGDSISQARDAVLRILDALRAQDSFNVILFGSSHQTLFEGPMMATPANVSQARNRLAGLQADMGGTEIGSALLAAYMQPLPAGRAGNILLITDGETYQSDPVIQAARRSGQRIFTIGVGSAVNQVLVEQLASATGGACELVSPLEDMAEKIVRHFKRISYPQARDVRVDWPQAPEWITEQPLKQVFDGDTVHVFGRFQQLPQGEITLHYALADGNQQAVTVHARPDPRETAADPALPGPLARMAAACRIRELGSTADALALALHYQLLTGQTNYLVLDLREADQKAKDLPALRKVPSMVPAGWHGLGTVYAATAVAATNMATQSLTAGGQSFELLGSIRAAGADTGVIAKPVWENPDGSLGGLEFPVCPPPQANVPPVSAQEMQWFITALNRQHIGDAAARLQVTGIGDLRNLGLPATIASQLSALVTQGMPEAMVIAVFLHAFAALPTVTGLSRETRRAITHAFQLFQPDAAQITAITRIAQAMAGQSVTA